MRLVYSEWLKTKRTPIRWLTFVTPILFAGFVLVYFSIRGVRVENLFSVFTLFFEGWTVLVIPIGAGLLPGLMSQQEEIAGQFTGWLANQIPRHRLYLSKLAILMASASVSLMMATCILLAGLTLLFQLPTVWPIFTAAVLLAIMGTFPLLALHLWVSLAWGIGASIAIGGAGLLVAALMATSLGDSIWPIVPWAWPVRMAIFPGFYLHDWPGLEQLPASIASGIIMEQTMLGLFCAIVFFIVIVGLSLVWFNRWEGRKAVV